MFFEAAKKKYEAQIAEAEAVLRLYLFEPVAVAEHSNHLEEIDKWLAIMSDATEKLESLSKISK